MRAKVVSAFVIVALVPLGLLAILNGRTTQLALIDDATRLRQRKVTEDSIFDAEMGWRLSLRILLAEDHVTNQKLALMILQRLGYRADFGATTLAALCRKLEKRGQAGILNGAADLVQQAEHEYKQVRAAPVLARDE